MSDSWFNIRAKIEVPNAEVGIAFCEALVSEEIVCSLDTSPPLPIVLVTMEQKPPFRDKVFLRKRLIEASAACDLEFFLATFDEEFVWYAKDVQTVN